jgi:ferredoxin
MNLLALIEGLAAGDSVPTGVTLEAARCLHSWDKAAACTACFDICPVAAIRPDKPPLLDSERCIRCRACLPGCPVAAYQAADELAPLFKQAARLPGGRLELICGPHPYAELGPAGMTTAVLTRGCLAGLGSGAYLALAALGPSQLHLRTDACADCPLGSLQSEIEAQVAKAQQLLDHWPDTAVIHCTGELNKAQLISRPARPANRPALSRRELFGLEAQQTRSLPHWLNEADETPDRKRPAPNHRLITAALAYLGQPDTEKPLPILDGLGLATITVAADKCTACGVCARACPTGALHFDEETEADGFRLSLSVPDCVGCGLCDHVCLPEAIVVEPHLAWDQLFAGEKTRTLVAGPLAACERCSTKFWSKAGEPYCPICELRRQNPFASIVPPSLKRQMSGRKQTL